MKAGCSLKLNDLLNYESYVAVKNEGRWTRMLER